MGVFSRFMQKKKGKSDPPAVARTEAARTHKVTFRCPQYFKQEPGGWYVYFDKTQYTVDPLDSISVELTEGIREVSVTSYPETLGEMTADITVDREMILSVSVNMLDRSMKMFDYQHNVTISTR